MKSKSAGEINGFLDRNTSLNGELRFRDMMRIDGKITGRIVSDNLLVVGETAEIDADIEVAAISIMGKVAGTLRATARVEVHPGAVLMADVTTPVFVLDEGAIFQGRCDMNQEPVFAEEKTNLVSLAEATAGKPARRKSKFGTGSK